MSFKNQKQNENIEWYYAHDADLTIGEAKISKTAKIVLYSLIAVLVIAAGFGIYFRTQLYDYIVNPSIVLSQKEVTIGIDGEFDPAKYVLNDDPHIKEIIYPDLEYIDFSKEGEHELNYYSRNSVHENISTLTLKIVDDIPPTITLTSDMLLLTRGDATKNFNPLDYIEDYSDNYTPKEELKLEYTESFDWSKDGVVVTYIVTDGNGLQTIAKLPIGISNESTHDHQWDDGKVTTEATVEHPGVMTYTCQICGETTSVPIPQLQPETKPDDSSETSTDPGNESSTDPSNESSTDPGNESKPAHTHSWDGGRVTSQPSCTSQGTRTYTCSECGQTTTEAIAALGHSWNGGEIVRAADVGVTGIKRYTCTRCGQTYDETIPALQPPPGPFINGVHDISVKVGTNFQSFQQQLVSGIQGSSAVGVDFGSVNLTVPGTYTVTYYLTDNTSFTKTCTVTVVE